MKVLKETEDYCLEDIQKNILELRKSQGRDMGLKILMVALQKPMQWTKSKYPSNKRKCSSSNKDQTSLKRNQKEIPLFVVSPDVMQGNGSIESKIKLSEK